MRRADRQALRVVCQRHFSHFANGLPVILARPDAADFILLTGMDDTRPTTEYRRLVRPGRVARDAARLRQSDLARITPAGLKPGAGAIAARYADQGGVVHYVGKPHREIYAHCLSLAAGRAWRSAIRCITTSPAAAAGIDTLLVMNGVHGADFQQDTSAAELTATMRRIVGDEGALPGWAVRAFCW